MKSNSCEMPFDENDITQYNPLHNVLGINPKKRVREYTERLSYNKFEFIDTEGNKKTCFKKFITLVDYVKYLIGKYKPEEMNTLPSIENFNNKDNQFQEYINSQHNYAYVDGFFYFLTSKLLKGGFVHGLDFYDNYVCLTKNCEINIADDFEYLSDSDFFNEHINKLFQFKDETFGNMFKKNVPISLSDETIEIEMDTLDDLEDDADKVDTNKVDANKVVNEQHINPIVLAVETLDGGESECSEKCESECNETCETKTRESECNETSESETRESETSESDTCEELEEIMNNDSDEFISSDNPVIYSNPKGESLAPFDSKNILQFPLDSKHLLLLIPSDEHSLTITRISKSGSMGVCQKLTANYSQFQNADKFILGNESGLKSYLSTKAETERPLTSEESEKFDNVEAKLNAMLKELGI
mgnify:CR=1 FL=1